MRASGLWTIEMKTPLGRQEAFLRLAEDAESVTGSIESKMLGSAQITNGKVNGGTLTWVAALRTPLPTNCLFTVTIDGDLMTGAVCLGRNGDAPLKGTRAPA